MGVGVKLRRFGWWLQDYFWYLFALGVFIVGGYLAVKDFADIHRRDVQCTQRGGVYLHREAVCVKLERLD